MSQKPTESVASESSASKPAGSAKGDKAAGAQSNLVTKSVAIGIGSAAIVAALMFVRRR